MIAITLRTARLRFRFRTPLSLVSALVATLLLLAALAAGCRAVKPSNDRDWSPDQALLSRADVNGQLVTIRNIRNCQYRSANDYTVRYYDRTFDMSRIRSVDFLVIPFPGSPSVAHTMLSFGFEGDQYLAVSAEVRKEKGEKFDGVKAMFRQYELMYVVGDERDLIALRTNHQQHDVYMYRLRFDRFQTQELFVDIAERVNKLAAEPEFYNTLTNNCTTNVARHINAVSPVKVSPSDYRLVLPGYSDRLVYDLGLVENAKPFADVRTKAKINAAAVAYRDAPDFSARLRR